MTTAPGAARTKGSMEDPKYKAIRLKGKAYTEFREQVGKRAKWRCQTCRCFAPLTLDGFFEVIQCGHVSHIKSKGSGGSDTMDNVIWECWMCHGKHHGPKWSKALKGEGG